MLLPIRTDCPPRRRPTVNITLIVVNVVIFLATYLLYPDEKHRLAVIDPYMLHCAEPKLHQFITYAFLHADLGHLLGNMIFLYIFGNSLNDKLGHLEYLLFYLGGAVFSGAVYTLSSMDPMLGASGAIAAVTGGFLILFPRSHIEVLYWFFFIGTFEIPSLYLIVFKMVLYDNVIAPSLPGTMARIAYGAHLAGYLFGFVVPLALLALRMLPRDQFDILSLWSRAYRRLKYRRAVSSTEPPFAVGLKQARPIRATVREVKKTPADSTKFEEIGGLRRGIDEALERYDLATAAETYLALIALDGDQILSRRQQLDVANQLMSVQKHTEAADAYEKYLYAYPTGEQSDQVKLLLGLICSRNLSQPDKARALLEEALDKLGDESQRTLCQEELDRINK